MRSFQGKKNVYQVRKTHSGSLCSFSLSPPSFPTTVPTNPHYIMLESVMQIKYPLPFLLLPPCVPFSQPEKKLTYLCNKRGNRYTPRFSTTKSIHSDFGLGYSYLFNVYRIRLNSSENNGRSHPNLSELCIPQKKKRLVIQNNGLYFVSFLVFTSCFPTVHLEIRNNSRKNWQNREYVQLPPSRGPDNG